MQLIRCLSVLVLVMLFIVADNCFLTASAASSKMMISSNNSVSTADQSALLAFKSRLLSYNHQNNQVLNTNWSESVHVCHWIGVTCGKRHRRVTALNLSSMNLVGTIPPHIGNLSFLAEMDTSRNRFQGPLPRELVLLPRLRQLILRFNNFGGEIPSWFGLAPKLQELDLSHNHFTGSIPPEVFNMSSVNRLDLSANNLFGSLPESSMVCDNDSITPSPLKYLDLSRNQLHGRLPSALFKCKQLQELILYFNNFTGSIPGEIGNLHMLVSLRLAFNDFEGEIPDRIGYLQKLEMVSLQENKFTGPIPSGIFNMSSLRATSLGWNQLTGPLPMDKCDGRFSVLEEFYAGPNNIAGSIPSGIQNCTSLRMLFLFSNQLKGVIPYEIADLPNLEEIQLSHNLLSGILPANIFNMSQLTVFEAINNSLSGQLPQNVGFNLPNLQYLDLDLNDLDGSIPNSICNSSKLVSLDLSTNSFSGFVPRDLGNLRHIRLLNLYDNLLTAESSTLGLTFLSSLSNCKELKFLGLSANQFNGIIPRSIGNLSALETFWADICEFQGTIPEEIGNLTKLIRLQLTDNSLRGQIPATIGQLNQLQGFLLEDNELQGPIPTSLCGLENLELLYLDHNELSGSIPACLSNITSLRKIGLDSNKLISVIPATLWSLADILYFNLSGNYLDGELSSEIGNLRAVLKIDLSNNLLQGVLPPTIGSLLNLQTIHLQSNKLRGQIPDQFTSMFSLQSLDLSHNNFSGRIPVSLAKVLHLQYLNLSFNHLEGEIPTGGPFSNFSADSFLMNANLCGEARFGVPPCSSARQHNNKKKTLMIWLKFGLPVFLGILLLILVLFFLGYMRRRRKQGLKEVSTDTELMVPSYRRISQEEILRATEGFNDSNLIGQGSFGTVYRGTLSDGIVVAIKVFNLEVEGAFKSFDAECEVLRSARHRNLVKVISSCCNEHLDFKALVLEYMPNGSLEKWLYAHNNCLSILQRLDIAIDVATGLEYLHHGQPTPILHCDLKPSNVLLDADMVAHVSDFGTAKLLGDDEVVRQTMTLATIGYMAPEYGLEGIVSTKSDVYSFGILLMEIFTRKRPSDDFFKDGEMNLRRWVEETLLNAGIDEVVDANLLGMGMEDEEEESYNAKIHCVGDILQLALCCSRDSPGERISMQDATSGLAKIKNTLLQVTPVSTRTGPGALAWVDASKRSIMDEDWNSGERKDDRSAG